jgi:hypothetical protein
MGWTRARERLAADAAHIREAMPPSAVAGLRGHSGSWMAALLGDLAAAGSPGSALAGDAGLPMPARLAAGTPPGLGTLVAPGVVIPIGAPAARLVGSPL